MMLPETEYGIALIAMINQEIEAIERKEPTMKICDDPIREDFRYQMGMKDAFKRILRKPQELKNEQIQTIRS